MPDFSNVTIIKHPDYNSAIQNREKQMLNAMPPSKAKQKRDAKRQRKVIPMG